MDITQTSFLGATVSSYSASVGWNEQTSSVSVQLVQDTLAGDKFQPGPLGQAVVFSMGEFRFEGLLQHWQQKHDMGGNPTYEVSIIDPRGLLAGVQVILSAFKEPTGGIPNLFNVYGYWENKLGFGGALSNESGMVWSSPFSTLGLDTTSGGASITITPADHIGIKPALEAMSLGSPYGGPIQYQNQSFLLDLSGLPPAPPYYRLGGISRTILELVSELCQDAGHDYLAYLENNTIKFLCVSRLDQPEMGQVAHWVMSQDNAVTKSIGVELRNDITNAVLLGGDVCDLIQVRNDSGGNTIWPFWGYDVNNLVIMGQGDPADGHEFYLNASDIADILGDVKYHCTIPELRCALIDYESWAAYVMRWYPKKAATMGLVNSVDSTSDLAEVFPDVMFRRDMIAEGEADLIEFGRMNESTYWTQRAQRFYNFVQNYASEYLGKKFLVRIPFSIYWKFEPETTHVVSSNQISTEGAYVPEGSLPLGLNYQDIDKFLTEDGRFECFVSFPYVDTMNLQKLDPTNAVLSNGNFYMKASIDEKIVYPDGSVYPYCVITLAEPVYELAPDPLGGVEEIAKILNIPSANVMWAAGLRHGSFPVRIHPAPFRPTAVAVPMKSNRDSYGPWGTFSPWAPQGTPGLTHFERDESLTPWNYGDWDTMNKAASAKLAGLATNMQESEIASVEVVGLPSISLGEKLVASGPNVTGIECSLSPQGIMTTYRMQTFTPQFGAFQKQNADRLRRLGIAAQQIRRSIRALYLRSREANRVQRRAQLGFMQNTARAVVQKTPHDVILGTMTKSEAHGYRTQVSSATIDELMANVRTDNPEIYGATGGMGLEGLYRPFSTAYKTEDAGGMPHFEESPADVWEDAVTTEAVDPIRNSDIDIVVNGKTYQGHMHRLRGEIDYDNARGIGFRGPMVLTGWGAEYTGKPIPNDEDETKPIHEWSDEFSDDPKLHPEKWRCGIVGLHWDNWRKLWTVPTMLEGKLDEDLEGDGEDSVLMTIQVNGKDISTGDKVKVYCSMGGSLKKDDLVTAFYYPLENKMKVMAVNCKV